VLLCQRTWDGVDVCALRVLEELKGTALASQGSLRFLSLFGYSFGGLVARYLAGALLQTNFLGLTPLNLVTSATPHLGVTLLSDPRARRVTTALGSSLGGRSGAQMLLRDGEKLLVLMAHPDSYFARGAASFKRLSLYANAVNDRTVPFWTSFIAHVGNDGVPAGPPTGGARASPYPHIDWEGSDAAAEGGASRISARHAENGNGRLAHSDVDAPPVDALSAVERAKLLLLAPLLLVLAPLWITIVPGSLALLGIYKRHTLRPPGEGKESTRLLNGRYWSDVMCEEKELFDEAAVQRHMSQWLNALRWHKVSVRFTLARDGLAGLHTHPLIVQRRESRHAAGADVIQHLVNTFARAPMAKDDET